MSKMLINAYSLNTNQIKHVYMLDGVVHKEIVNFKPFLGVHAGKDEVSSWTDMYGKKVKIKVFDSIVDMHKWKKENKGILEIFGDIDPVDMFVATQYRGDIELDTKGMKIFNVDIECVYEDIDYKQKLKVRKEGIESTLLLKELDNKVNSSEYQYLDSTKTWKQYTINDFKISNGFPNATDTKNVICSITINEMVTNTYTLFAFDDYKVQNDNETFIKCGNELDLLTKFLHYWNEQDPQIITGWGINHFDIPYLVNRINKICGSEQVKNLSPDRVIKQVKETNTANMEVITYKLQGIIIWDYLELYRKYTQETRESYTLDNIASVELGDQKIAYHDEHDNILDFYKNDTQLFLQYNIKDTALVYDINYKLDYINVAMSIMQKAKCRSDKIFGTISPWDCIIYNELLSRKILCPPNKHESKIDFVGGYVEEPIVGLHDWIMMYDIVSSYPSQIRSYNLSTETVIEDNRLPQELKDIKTKFTGIDKCSDINFTKEISDTLKKYNVCFTSNGYFFDISKEGIIPSIFSKLFLQRVEYKKDAKRFKKESKKREEAISSLYSYTFKILLNSGYGGIANNFSRYFDIRIAEAVTSNGQISCKGVMKTMRDKLNLDIIYGDTDSVAISVNPILEKRYGDKCKEIDNKTKVDFLLKYGEKFIEPKIVEFFENLKINMNMRELKIEMEAECIADVTLFTAKKRYIMNKVWDEGTYYIDNPKRKIRGVEIVRSSTPKICRERLKEAVELIFSTKDNNVLIEFIESFKKEFFTLPIETIASPRGVKFSNYKRDSKGLPIAVGAAFAFNDYLKKLKLDKKYPSVSDGDKIRFCYLKTPNHIGSHVIGFPNKLPTEMNGTFKIDYETQFDKVFFKPLEKILTAINWNMSKINTLEDFFS